MNTEKYPVIEKLVDAPGLLAELFPNPESRPSIRWLRSQQKARSIPYVKWGRLVMFDPQQVRAALTNKNMVRAV